VKRRVLLALAIALAAAAGFWLVRGAGHPAAVSRELHADIDDASRAKLEQLLEEADRTEADAREATRKKGQER